MGWNKGYGMISVIQLVLSAVIFLSLPLWKTGKGEPGEQTKPLSMKQTVSIRGAKEVMVAFFCYCGLEQTCILWGSSYLVLHNGLDEETAASLAALFMLGLTFGRFLNGFLTYKINDTNLIRLGQSLIGLGVVIMLLPVGNVAAMAGLTLMGLGCAPIYPCIIHMTPDVFGKDKSQAMIGMQMAFAYTGFLVMPPLFGAIADRVSIAILPAYLTVLLALMILTHEIVVGKKNERTAPKRSSHRGIQ